MLRRSAVARLVAAAAERVSWSVWSLDGRGSPRPQAVERPLVEAMIGLLEVGPGAAVLEIGPGCGYTTAVLAHLVTGSGRVISVDSDGEVVARLRPMLAAAGLAQVRVLCADGRGGHPPAAPYDGMIAWVAVAKPPAAWRSQLRPGAIVVVPELGHPRVRRLRNGEDGFQEEASIPGYFSATLGGDPPADR